MKTRDEASNESPLSNVPSITTVDQTAPGLVTDLTVAGSAVTNGCLGGTVEQRNRDRRHTLVHLHAGQLQDGTLPARAGCEILDDRDLAPLDDHVVDGQAEAATGVVCALEVDQAYRGLEADAGVAVQIFQSGRPHGGPGG